MELSVSERLMLGVMIAPVAADVVTLRVVRNLQEELSFSSEEIEALQFVQEDKQVRWNMEVPQTKEFAFGAAAMYVIVEQLKKASDSKALTLPQLGLYDKFVPVETEGVV